MINRHNDSTNLTLVIVLGIILMVSLILTKPAIDYTMGNNVGLSLNALRELRKFFGH